LTTFRASPDAFRPILEYRLACGLANMSVA